ncbi:helix-turn-helix domain-containing protein [Cellulosimicrobium sp. RS]|uniref:helix-turn-helix domain-containing protein n=1 Tax=Cellulosimicrobium sp. RS TaxID=3381347 RepID=UPI0038FC764D
MGTEETPAVVIPVVYRVEEAAEALRISRDSIYELIRSGRLRTIKVGSRRLVPVVALSEYVTTALDGAS